MTTSRRFLVRAAQVSPIDIRAQVFAADGAASGALDVDAALGRDWSFCENPLVDRWSRHAERCRQRRLATDSTTGFLDWFLVHANNGKATPNSLSIGIA